MNCYLRLGIVFFFLLSATSSFAAEKKICQYLDKDGTPRLAHSTSEIPARFRKSAQCVDAAQLQPSGQMASPKDLELAGSVRREQMNSSLGPLTLRWPRNVEGLFGRSPLRAVQEAARAVSRVIRQSSFPTHVQQLNVEWNVVFIDTREPETQAQIPPYLVQNCHPGWMTPPANIYIVAQRVAGDCSVQKSGSSQRVSSSVADAQLAEVLVHEFGHAIEYILLRGRGMGQSRLQAEGFATWFEHYAASQSPMLNAREMDRERLENAKMSFKSSPHSFSFSRGDSFDYARASMYFTAIEKRFGVRGVLDVYDEMTKTNGNLFQATRSRLGLNQQQLEEEVARLLR